jgi:DNA-binding transcriptional MocR family regulator
MAGVCWIDCRRCQNVGLDPGRPAMTQPAPASPESLVNPAYRNIGESLVRELSRLMADPAMISLAGGYPGAELFDRDGVREAANAALTDSPTACLQYGPTEGMVLLRESVAQWMTECSTPVSPDELLILSGSAQGFDLLVRTLIRPGDCAVVERPTYTGPIRVLKVAGARTLTVGVDAHGLDVDELESLLRDPAMPRPRLLYVVPTFANPSGASMPIERRLKLLRLAVEYGFVIAEDDPYSRLRFEGDVLPHLYALTDQVPGSRQWVVHLGSFSKVIAPGLRVAWMAGPETLRRPCMLAKQLDDLSNPGFTQMTVHRYLKAGRLREHLPVIVGAYRERAAAMRDAIATHLAGRVAFNIPQGGMFMWGRLEDGLGARDLLPHAIAEKVTFVPGDIYYADQSDPSTLRLSFSTPSPGQIGEGVARLGRAVARLRA